MTDITNLVEWCRENGGFCSDQLKLETGPSGSTGYAVSDIKSTSKLLSCPRNLVMDYSKASALWEGDQKPFESSPVIAIRLFLSYQKVLGHNSAWAPYIRVLPDTFDTPLYFDEDDMKLLEGTNMYGEVELRRQAWMEEWQDAVKSLPENLDKTQFTWDLYLWASTVLTSRSFPSALVLRQDEKESYPVLVPLVDSLNHKPLTSITWTATDEGFEISTNNNIAASKEVFNNYGPKGNEELLMGYGFCIENNEFDVVTLRLRPPPGSAELKGSGGLFRLSMEDPIPNSLFMFYAEVCANAYEKQLLQNNRVSRRCELATLVALRHSVTAKVDAIINCDQYRVISAPTERQRFAMIYIDRQKKILLNTAKTIADRLEDEDLGINVETIFKDLEFAPFTNAVSNVFLMTDANSVRDMQFEDEFLLFFLCYLSLVPNSHDGWIKIMHELYDKEVDEELALNFESLYEHSLPAFTNSHSRIFDDRFTCNLLAWASLVVDGETVDFGGRVCLVMSSYVSEPICAAQEQLL
ncbi:hypothetical protein V1512DRAFT_255412 [Lipomyces arxii]|uniref:uncharacterized protein n=1 Tax=Lipomyces arxii TaxID=56418 RepID=UPI0034CEC678